MEEAAESEREPCVRRGEGEDGVVAELRAAGAPVHAFEEPDEVRPVGAVDRGRTTLTRDRQLGINAGDVEKSARLEVENSRVLAQVRDLEDAAVEAVLDEEHLVALTSEADGFAMEVEEIR